MRNLVSLLFLVCALLAYGSFAHLNDQANADATVAQSPAQPSSGLLPNAAQTDSNVPADAKKELMAAAKAHKVKIKTDRMAYVSNQKMTIVRAPIVGIEKYSDSKFAAGAPIVLIVIKSKMKLTVPDGSYVVKVRYQRQPKSGKAIFTDRTGAVAVERNLDQPIFLLDDPNFPDPDDRGAAGIDSCKIYLEMFPLMTTSGGPPPTGFGFPCRDCACDYYNWVRSRPGAARPPGGVSSDTEINAWFAGRDAGRACMAAPTHTCPPVR